MLLNLQRKPTKHLVFKILISLGYVISALALLRVLSGFEVNGMISRVILSFIYTVALVIVNKSIIVTIPKFRILSNNKIIYVIYLLPILELLVTALLFIQHIQSIILPSFWLAILFFLFVGIFEEVIFRGILFSILGKPSKHKTYLFFILFSSIIFALSHYSYDNIGAVFGAFSLGVLCCVVVIMTKNIWSSVLIHALHDYTVFLMTNPNFHNLDLLGTVNDVNSTIPISIPFVCSELVIAVLCLYTYMMIDKS